jgi:hypothetical protein
MLICFLQNFLPKLREHLLPRIQAALSSYQEANSKSPSEHPQASPQPVSSNGSGGNADFVFLKKDCVYRHKFIRFHFTTYDVRRGTDAVNTGTSRCDIMLLADHTDGPVNSSIHHFLYARVLGAYHANVIYTGPGMRDFEARRFDFLWVRWFEVVDTASSGWSTSTLDEVCFPPIHRNNSFGFVDPNDVLRGCHMLPSFAKGKRQADGIGISRCAKDGKDYKIYYVGRYAVLLTPSL